MFNILCRFTCVVCILGYILCKYFTYYVHAHITYIHIHEYLTRVTPPLALSPKLIVHTPTTDKQRALLVSAVDRSKTYLVP